MILLFLKTHRDEIHKTVENKIVSLMLRFFSRDRTCNDTVVKINKAVFFKLLWEVRRLLKLVFSPLTTGCNHCCNSTCFECTSAPFQSRPGFGPTLGTLHFLISRSSGLALDVIPHIFDRTQVE